MLRKFSLLVLLVIMLTPPKMGAIYALQDPQITNDNFNTSTLAPQWNGTSISDAGFHSKGNLTLGAFRMNITNGLGAFGTGNYQLETNYTRGYVGSPSTNFSIIVDYNIINQPPTPVGSGHYIDYGVGLEAIALTGSPSGTPIGGTVGVDRVARIGDTSGLVGPTPKYSYFHIAADTYGVDLQTTNTTGSFRLDHFATNGSFVGYVRSPSSSSVWYRIGGSTPTFNGVVTGYAFKLFTSAHPANNEPLGSGWVADFDNFQYTTPPYQLTFRVNPSTVGVILFNGTQYKDGDTRKLTGIHTYPIVTLKRGVTSSQGLWNWYKWVTSGGVSVSYPYTNNTFVNVTGPGTLTAVYVPATPTLAPIALLLVALFAGLMVPIARTLRRSKPSGSYWLYTRNLIQPLRTRIDP